MYHLSGNVISATVGFVYINLQPEFELASSTRFGKFRKLGKIGAPSSPATPRKLSARARVLVHGYLRVRFDLTSSINFKRYNRFSQIGGP